MRTKWSHARGHHKHTPSQGLFRERLEQVRLLHCSCSLAAACAQTYQRRPRLRGTEPSGPVAPSPRDPLPGTMGKTGSKKEKRRRAEKAKRKPRAQFSNGAEHFVFGWFVWPVFRAAPHVANRRIHCTTYTNLPTQLGAYTRAPKVVQRQQQFQQRR